MVTRNFILVSYIWAPCDGSPSVTQRFIVTHAENAEEGCLPRKLRQSCESKIKLNCFSRIMVVQRWSQEMNCLQAKLRIGGKSSAVRI